MLMIDGSLGDADIEGCVRRIGQAFAAIFATVCAGAPAAANGPVDVDCDAASLAIEARYRAPNQMQAPYYDRQCWRGDRTERIILNFDVDADGEPKNVTVAESTNECVNEEAVKAAQAWRYRCVGDGLSGLSTVVRFSAKAVDVVPLALEESGCLELSDDARPQPIARQAPAYPNRCMGLAANSDRVRLEFDVTPDGRTENIQVAESTNSCLDEEALAVAATWRYACSIAGAKSVRSVVVFNLAGGVPEATAFASCAIFDSRVSIEDVLADPALAKECKKRAYYPSPCYRKSEALEHVALRFDITPSGQVENIRIEASTEKCFNAPTMKAMARMEYAASEKGFKDVGALFKYHYNEINYGR